MIVHSRFVAPMRGEPIENGAVAIRGDRIVGVGSRAEIDRRFQSKQRLDRPDLARKYGIAVVPTVLRVAPDGVVLERLAP